ncbi:type II toxin-antitoxin system RelE/ParE family toxin [Massilia violaceinigra]|uniref:Type II toxin-antitoxin system RelE/ParE family toxin n=1 Tax=Massilia violaceinigra TaxID=2045208 RepID=A0ABY4A1B9_9BURK|nr:type II toxin-antitoxin system RelE/ParE family toxin [Massilia violaceinigra]UOD28547.1 type II toxin-antitoxin system RelE/ParE family toxin [Massilia violaceinigra]
MHVVIWKKRAMRDLVRIGRFIAKDSPASARQVLGLIEDRVRTLATYPNLGHVGRKAGTLELVVHEHYVVIYRSVAARVEILNIKHTSRKWPPTR